MNVDQNTAGFAFFCDQQGKIKKILRDDIGFKNLNPRGKLFSSLVYQSSRNKVLNFLLDVRTNRVAFNYYLELGFDHEIETFYFIGILFKEIILVIGANSYKDALEYTNHLQQINNEQSNLIRQLFKDKYKEEQKAKESDELFVEITKLNNELVNLQRELTRKNAELERLDELKNQFLGMAVHDMRNPLNVISAYAEIMMKDGEEKLSKDYLRFLRTMHSSSKFMFKLIEDLLDISKIDSGKLQLHFEASDIVDFAKENVQRNTIIASRKNIRLTFTANVDFLILMLDVQKIEQVFNNLIGNAIKFSYPDSEIAVNIEQKADMLQIQFVDHGTGIEKENYNKIFVPFQKLAAKGTDGEKGTGLGLTIVKNIIEGHDGKIWFESKHENEGKNHGTTFFVELPVKELT